MTKKQEIYKASLRKKYFGLLKKQGIDDDLRHEIQLNITGKESSKYFEIDDFLSLISALQGRNDYDDRDFWFKKIESVANQAGIYDVKAFFEKAIFSKFAISYFGASKKMLKQFYGILQQKIRKRGILSEK